MAPLDSDTLSLELLKNDRWLRPLARRLVRDESTADDLVQETWVAAVLSPLRDPLAWRPWLRRVLGNRAKREYRSRLRRESRERRSARRESVESASDDIVERVELQSQIASTVVALDEPYRTTVLLRYYEGLSVEEIAGKTRVPRKTVYTRLNRALERLRSLLSARYSSSGADWKLAILPVTGWDVESFGASTAGASSTASTSAASTSAASTTAAAGTLTEAMAGSILVTKTTFIAAGAVVVTLCLGFGIGNKVGRLDTESVQAVLRSEHRTVATLRGELDGMRARLTQQLQEERLRRTALEEKVAESEASLASAREELASVREASKPPTSANLPVAFGEWAGLEGIAAADWEVMGSSVLAMNDVWMEVLEAIAEGKPMTPEFQQRLREENNKLVGLAASIMGKIPTNSPINGEFTHPIVLSNLIASVLEQSGLPLTEEQRAEFQSLGSQYEEEYKLLETEYGEGTPMLRKIVDELKLKHEAMGLMQTALTDEQRSAMMPAELKDRLQMDVLSPFTMAIMLAKPTRPYDSPEDYRAAVMKDLTGDFHLDEGQVAALSSTLDQFFRDIAPAFSKTDASAPPTIQQALIAGESHVKLVETILQLPGISEQTRGKLVAELSWDIPRLKGE